MLEGNHQYFVAHCLTFSSSSLSFLNQGPQSWAQYLAPFYSNGIKNSCSYKSVSNSMEIRKHDSFPAFFVALIMRDVLDSVSFQYKAIKRI